MGGYNPGEGLEDEIPLRVVTTKRESIKCLPIKWEQVGNPEQADCLYRAPIFGGWLVRDVQVVMTSIPDYYGNGGAFRKEQGHEQRSSMTFVPDPNHEWDLTKQY